jgi:hypothetical protein
VEYPPPSNDPAGRDIWCEAAERNWKAGRAIAFQIKSAHATRLSVSFFDRNHAAYTSWTDLPDTAWRTVRIAFDSIRPNPYFQLPDARLGVPMDVGDVNGVALAPQDQAAGRLLIAKIVLRR